MSKHRRHGRWHSPRGGGWHPGRCNVSGAHVVTSCGIQHRDHDWDLVDDRWVPRPCPALRIWCPERGAHIYHERGWGLPMDV